jgi:hypothetical protein
MPLYTEKFSTKIHFALILTTRANRGLLLSLSLEYPSCYINYDGTGRILYIR